jgi:hypothetical protein
MRRLRQVGWDKPDLPHAWQFLHIDVPTHADGDDVDLPPQLPSRQYKGIVRDGIGYSSLDKTLLSKGKESIRDALATWRPDPHNVAVPPWRGAGQYRALGRIITLTGIEDIHRAVQNAKKEMTGTGVTAELQEVTRLLRGEPGDPAEPTVVVISSIAGGTGAGAVIDVCDVIRSLPDKWADQSFGFLYCPDVFNELAEENRKGVRANALTTLAELMNGYWNNQGPSDEAVSLFAANQVNLSRTSLRSGPRFPFLVGAANDRVSYRSQNEIYRAMGRSIASWVASERLQDAFTAYIAGNWTSTNSSADKLPLRLPHSESPFTALGSARVGLGRDLFAEYAAEYLARAAVDRVTKVHEQARRGFSDDRTDKQIVADLEKDLRLGFRMETGLDELGPDHNDILNAFHADTNAAVMDYQSKITAAVGQLISVSKKGAPPAEAMRRAAGAVREHQERISSGLRDQTFQRAQAWVPDIQRRIASVTAKRLSEAGGLVTHALLRNLIVTMGEVRAELSGEAQDFQRRAAESDNRVHEALASNEKALITSASDPMIQRVASDAIRASIDRYEADLRNFARDVIGDLVTQFLQPLASAVGNAQEKLTVTKASADSPYVRWPEGESVPKQLQPANNEFLLHETSQYRTKLDELIRRTKGVDADPKDAWRSAEVSVLLGVKDTDEFAAQQLIKITDHWVPSNPMLNTDFSTPRQARFEVAVSEEDIAKRAEGWVTQEGTPIGRFMKETLSEYLSKDGVPPAEHVARLDQFEGKFGAALDAAAPLVKVNPAVLVAVHGKDQPCYTLHFSEIPLPTGSPAKERIRKVLENRGLWREEVAKSFTEEPGDFVDVFSHFNEAYQAVVFDSLMRPISEDWGQKSKNADSRREFALWRRSRPIPEFVPVGRSLNQSVLTDMVRGWYVATRLGHLRLSSTKAEIFIPETSVSRAHWAPFPSPMLSPEDLTGPAGVAVTLVGLVIALLDVNSRESLAPMEPYARLAELGRNSGAFDFDLNGELKDWILNGRNLNPEATNAMATRGLVTPEDRQQFVVSEFKRVGKRLEEHFATIERERFDPNDYPREWDLRFEILNAINYLVRAAQSVSVATETGGWS